MDKKRYIRRETVHAMNQLTLGLITVLFSVSVAAEWVKVGANAKAVTYIDHQTIRKDGDFRRVWELSNNVTPDELGVRSARALFEYDCKNEQFRFLSGTFFSGQMSEGEILKIENRPSAWYPIPPNTIPLDVLTIVCTQ